MKETVQIHNNKEMNIETIENSITINENNIPTARDIVAHFNKHLYPAIEKKYKSLLNPTKRGFLKLFKQKVQSESDIYKDRGIETATRITDFIIGNDTNNIIRIKLLLETIRIEMDRAYGNIRLDYTYAAEKYESQGQTNKAQLITHCLKILSARLRDSIATISFEGDNIIVETRKGRTTVHKDEFFKKN